MTTTPVRVVEPRDPNYSAPPGPGPAGRPPRPMFLLRDASPKDLPALLEIARALDSQNLPADEKALRTLLRTSEKSFTGAVRNPFERTYVFVLEDARGRLVGTSMVIAQHGTYESPHVFFDSYVKEHYSQSIGAHFRHRVLALRYNYEGPTEIGGLVVAPKRRHVGKPGKQLSYVRFLLMAMHPDRFRDEVIAELMPPLMPDGRSRMWEHLGRVFTGLDYQEADRLSRKNKEFIRTLFPQEEIYTTLLPKNVQRVIGRVGPETIGVRRMLEKIGFRFAETIDPFDGGPHFIARREKVTLVEGYERRILSETPLAGEAPERLVAVERARGPNRFRAVRTPVRFEGRRIQLPAEAAAKLGVKPRARLHTIPFE